MDGHLKQAKALFFDYFGTVVDWLSPVRQALADNAPAGTNVDWEEFAYKWRASFFLYVEKLADRQTVAFEEVQRRCLLEASSNNQWGWSEAQIDSLIESWSMVVPWDDSVSGLQKLREKFIW